MKTRQTIIPTGLSNDSAIDYLLGMLEDARTTTLSRLKDLSEEELHWQYADGRNSISVLLEHIIASSHFFRIIFLENRVLTKKEEAKYFPGMYMGKYIPVLLAKTKKLDYYKTELETSAKMMNEAILKLDKEQFFKKIDAYNPKTGANLAWILYHVVEDEVHHRGQISILRKLYKLK